MSNVNSDLLDEGLQAVMGKERCRDMIAEPSSQTVRKAHRAERSGEGNAVDAYYEPVKSTSALEKVKECAKWSMLFAAISGLLFYWQQAGLLASSAAVPSLIICALGAGLTIGWHAR